MLSGRFNITADTPIGTKHGVLTLRPSGDDLVLELEIKGLKPHSALGTDTGGGSFRVSGSVKVFPLGKISFEVNGIVEGDTLQAVCDTSKGEIVVFGTRC